MSTKKLKRNDKCHCQSGKKYKKCCLVSDQADASRERELIQEQMKNGHELTEEMQEMFDFFTTEYPTYNVIDITNFLTEKRYKALQLTHMQRDTIMIASRNDDNDSVFEKRGDGSTDWIVMFRGAHQVFNQGMWNAMKNQVLKMIETRLLDGDYQY